MPGRSIKTVFVANRGEIAVRVGRACKELGLRTVQAYSAADRDSLAVQFADRAVCIGGARSSESYLHIDALVCAALMTGADAVQP